MIKVTITKSEYETIKTKAEWDAIEDRIDPDSGKVLTKRGWTPQIDTEVLVERVIYSQELDDVDLRLAIAAINGLQLPPKVVGK